MSKTDFSLLMCLSSRVSAVQEQGETEPLKQPEDIIEAVEECKKTGDHTYVHNVLRDRKINLRTAIDEQGKGSRTIFRKLLEDAVNGDRIIKRELDKLVVVEGPPNENSIDYSVGLNFEGIFKEESEKQTRVVKDLLDLRAKHRDHWESLTSLVKHPVLAAFVIEKWQHVRWYYYWSSLIFVLFLFCFSGFTFYMFERPEVHCTRLQKQIITSQKQLLASDPKDKRTIVFPDTNDSNNCFRLPSTKAEMFLTEWDNGIAVLELAFFSLAVFLTVTEVYQVVTLRLQYIKELENYVEWIVLVSAYITMAFKHNLLKEDSLSATVRGVAALGICAAWLELIFIIGRYPVRGGDFSIMFYNIIKKTFRYVVAMAIMLLGFAFAFMVVHFGHNQDSFENPAKSFMMTLTMSLGEFNFEDLYNNFDKDTTSRVFAMILLSVLILFGTITMVNLFVAVIISDIDKLREEVYIQNIVNMAQYSILVEELLPLCILRKMRIPDKLFICVHTMCSSDCTRKKLPASFKPVVTALNEIVGRQRQDRNSSGPATSGVYVSAPRVTRTIAVMKDL